MVVVVLAGSYVEYHRFIEENALDKETYRYCTSYADIAPLPGSPVICCGRWTESPLYARPELAQHIDWTTLKVHLVPIYGGSRGRARQLPGQSRRR